jgi:hypothetical protein
MCLAARWSASIVALVIASAAGAAAQPTPVVEPTSRDGVALGASLSPALAGGLGFWPAIRVSAPLGGRMAFDVDAGWMFPSDNPYFSTRGFCAFQFRFLRKPRDAGGSSRFWIVGPALILGAELDGESHVTDPDARIGAIRLAYGGDRIYANGMRTAGEIGVIGGGSSAPTGVFASLVIQWRPRR